MDQPNKAPLFAGDSFETEATGDYPSIDEAFYTAVMGRSYRAESKNGYKMKVFETLLIKKSKDASDPIPILDWKQEEGKLSLSLRKNKAGELITESVIYPINFMDIQDSWTQKGKSFATAQRRDFARRFGALNEESGVIDWGLIQKQVGQIVSFNLVANPKNRSYVNVDFSSFAAHTGAWVTNDSIAQIYAILDAMKKPAKTDSLLPDEPPF